jgi:hypothetical protein
LAADATRRVARRLARRPGPRLAIALAAAGVLAPWTRESAVRLDGLEGPNNGWLVLILAVLALGWIGSMSRGSWVGVAGVGGAGLLMGWTALESWLDGRAGAAPAWGLFLVLAASAALAGAAVARGLELAAARARSAPR